MAGLLGLFVHGIGRQRAGFADDSRSLLREALRERGQRCWLESCVYADIADRIQDAMERRVERAGSAGGPFQKVSTGTLADAIMYLRSAHLRDAIYTRLDAAWGRFGGSADRRVILFAHSLGGLVVTDWLRLRPHVRPRGLVTFGCNLELFTMPDPFVCPPQLFPGQASWTNVFYRRDGLGWPLAPGAGFAHVRDVELPWELWRPSTWTGLAHNAYWDCEKLWTEHVPHWFS